LQDVVPDGICSCDVMLNKRSGNLYRYVHELHQVNSSEHIHIGDNLYSDVLAPSRIGVKAIHYYPDHEKQRRKNWQKLYSSRSELFRHIQRTAHDSVKAASGQARSSEETSFRLGIEAAPLFVGLALLVAERCLVDKVDQLFFFTREGEFFLKLYKAVVPTGYCAHHELPEPRLLEVSRLATFCASLQSVTVKEMMRLWTLYNTQSVFALAKSLGIDPEILRAKCLEHSIEIEEPIVHPWQDARVEHLFSDTTFQALIEKRVRSENHLVSTYLKQHGINDEGANIGVVDIGWRGTIQDNLAYILPGNKYFGYYLGLQRFLNPQPANCIKRSFGPDANLDMDFNHLLDAVSPIEMLCNSPFGSVAGYRLDADGLIYAERLIEPAENRVFDETVRHFQDGVLLAARHWQPYVESHAICSAELRQLGCKIWHRLILKPKRIISEAYASLSHNEMFGVGCFVEKRLVPAPEQLIKSLYCPASRRDVILYLRQTQWTSGLRHRRDLTLVHRGLLIAALMGGRAYKRLRLWMHYYAMRRHNEG
jgi:hypothetical protein